MNVSPTALRTAASGRDVRGENLPWREGLSRQRSVVVAACVAGMTVAPEREKPHRVR